MSQTKSLEKMKTILKYVEEHYSEHITIDDMAALTYYSKSHFMKFFKQQMGTGFIEYLNDYRLTMAERLLKTGSLNGSTGYRRGNGVLPIILSIPFNKIPENLFFRCSPDFCRIIQRIISAEIVAFLIWAIHLCRFEL